jgi:SPP1 gp7 family putative phage head morphogenesis protein
MKNELIRGIVVGSNPNETARRIMKATQGRFEGGAARAVRIARTETLDAMRAGAAAVDRQNKDVLKGWRWSADLSPRTCQACIGMHGRTFDLDTPGPEGHPNCRCARVPVTRSWADLGFKDIKEPPDLFPSAEAWFKGLSSSEQKRLLGPNHDAWKAGKFPLSQWAVKKENPGWRPAWHSATAA